MATPNEFDFSPEDAGGLVAPGSQKQAPVRFGSSPMPQGFEAIMSLAALGVSGAQWRNTAQFALAMLLGSLSDSEAKVKSPVQLLAATVDTLVEANEDQFLASLTDVDRQQLITTLDKLIDVVGENENHFLVPLRDLIANLIEKSEEYHDMKKLVPGRGLRAAYTADEPEYTPAQLNLIKSQYQNPVQDSTAMRMAGSRSPGRGLRAAYTADEPEYTPAQLNLIKSQRQNPTER